MPQRGQLPRVAVVTGDVVGSTEHPDRAAIPKILKDAFRGVARRIGPPQRDFEIYRGDSFQGVVAPEDALLAATIVRARLRAVRDPTAAAGRAGLDARVAIGIGTAEHATTRVVESDGAAFRSSGRALDELSSSTGKERLRVAGEDVPRQVDITVRLLDAIVGGWTVAAAESAFEALTRTDRTQAEMAKRHGVSQPAISQRLRAARLDDVLDLVTLYRAALGAA